jgi:hypothetical protein
MIELPPLESIKESVENHKSITAHFFLIYVALNEREPLYQKVLITLERGSSGT